MDGKRMVMEVERVENCRERRVWKDERILRILVNEWWLALR